jgi:hypothetical protein
VAQLLAGVAVRLKRNRVSVPVLRRLMFGRCSTTTASAATAANAITGQGSPISAAATGSESAAVIDASDG